MTPEKMSVDWNQIEDEHFRPIMHVRSQISCPFKCSFCSFPIVQGAVIKAELELLETELAALQRRGVRSLLFVDDTFNVPPRRFKKVLEILARYDFSWYGFIRCQFLTPELADGMRATGCRGAFLGLEAADDELLKNMEKKVTVEEHLRGAALLAERDIITYGSFIVGFPGDTEEKAHRITDFLAEGSLSYYNVKPFWYESSTPIAQRASEFGLNGAGYAWKHATMDSAAAQHIIRELILEIDNTHYVGVHAGELWEIASLMSNGFSRSQMDLLFSSHNLLMKRDLRGDPQDPAHEQQQLDKLTADLG